MVGVWLVRRLGEGSRTEKEEGKFGLTGCICRIHLNGSGWSTVMKSATTVKASGTVATRKD